jgi:HD superfamily phosphodiesterase
MEGIEIIRYDKTLQSAFSYIIKHNKSNYLPYHNLNHLLTVLKYSDMIAQGEEVYFDQRLPIHLAALFHDVNHSGGKNPDSENIKKAILTFSDFCESTEVSKEVQRDVVDMIEATQYPYVQPESTLSLIQKIIRDADMMQAFEYNWINQTTLGIAAESGMDIEEFIPKQRLFLESIQFRTKTAQKIKEEKWAKIMNEFRILEVSMGLNK